jgi:hypothetical protein
VTAWMLYCVTWSTCLSVAAILSERLLLAARAPVRWIWFAAIAASILGPVTQHALRRPSVSGEGVVVSESSAQRSAAVDAVARLDLATDETDSLGPGANADRGISGAGVQAVEADWLSENDLTSRASFAGVVRRFVADSLSRVASLDLWAGRLWGASSSLAALNLIGALAVLTWMRRRWERRTVLGTRVLVSERTGPAVLGVIHPEIVLPHWVMALRSRSLALLLTHEREHSRAGDSRLLGVAELAWITMPWNLALWWQIRRLHSAVELDCDARVLGDANAIEYGQLLLEVARRNTSGRVIGAPAFAGRAVQLERRIEALAKRTGRSRRFAWAGVCAIALAVLGIGWVTPRPPHAPPPIASVSSTVPSEQSCAGATSPSGETQMRWNGLLLLGALAGCNAGDAVPAGVNAAVPGKPKGSGTTSIATTAVPSAIAPAVTRAAVQRDCSDGICTVKAEEPAPTLEFDDVFEIVGKLVLEEKGQVVNQRPGYTADPQGGLLLHESSQNQFRRYDAAGRLIWNFGRSGQGPEEFSLATSITRVSENQVFAVQRHRKGVLWNELTGKVDRVITNPEMATMLGVRHLGGDRVLLAGMAVGDANPILHVLDLASGKVTASFFRPYLSSSVAHEVAIGMMSARAEVRADTIAVMLPYNDSLYVLDSSGALREKIILPSSRFRTPTGSWESFGKVRSDWIRHIDFIWKIYWLPSGDFIVAYSRTIESVTSEEFNRGMRSELESSMVGIRRDGSGMFEIIDYAPKFEPIAAEGSWFKGVDAAGNFYFRDPESILPNHLIVARLKVR